MIHLKQSGEHVAFSCNGQTSHGIASYEGSWRTTGPPHCMWQGSAQPEPRSHNGPHMA